MGVQRAYRLVSARCCSLQLVCNDDSSDLLTFQSLAVRFSLSSRTFNPKVAGSIPARRMKPRADTRIGGAERRASSAEFNLVFLRTGRLQLESTALKLFALFPQSRRAPDVAVLVTPSSTLSSNQAAIWLRAGPTAPAVLAAALSLLRPAR